MTEGANPMTEAEKAKLIAEADAIAKRLTYEGESAERAERLRRGNEAAAKFFSRGPQPETAGEVPGPVEREVQTKPEGEVQAQAVEDSDSDQAQAVGVSRQAHAEPAPKPAEPSPRRELNLPGERNLVFALLDNAAREAEYTKLAHFYRSDDPTVSDQYKTKRDALAERLLLRPSEVHHSVIQVAKKLDEAEAEEKKPKLTISQKALVFCSDPRLVRFWTDDHGSAYATVKVKGHWENMPLESGAFKNWVRYEYGVRFAANVDGVAVPGIISDKNLSEGIDALKAHVLSQRIDHCASPRVRVGGLDDVVPNEIWIDMCDPEWSVIRVTARGWTIEQMMEPPAVKFLRRNGMKPLPRPTRGGDIRELRPFINVRDEDFVLVVGLLVTALRPRGPYPIGMISGTSGSAKTTTCRVMLDLIDPNVAGLRSARKEDDIMVAAHNSHMIGFDNLSKMPADLADVMCRLATGIGYAKRKLYEDAEEFRMNACRPQLLNGIPDDLGERGDVADRAIGLYCPALEQEADEDLFWQEFEEAKPKILGALLDGMVAGLRDAKTINLEGFGRIRMQAFAKFAEAGCRVLGFGEDAFLARFVTNQARVMVTAFENDLVAQAITLMFPDRSEPREWFGNTAPLYTAARKAMEKANRLAALSDEKWPKNSTWFGRVLRRSAPLLKKVSDIQIDFNVDLRSLGKGDKDGMIIRAAARKAEPQAEPAGPAVAEPARDDEPFDLDAPL